MTATQNTVKFYSSKSNAARAAKAVFGEDFKTVAELIESTEGFAYVARAELAAAHQEEQAVLTSGDAEAINELLDVDGPEVKKELTDDELAALNLTRDDNCPHCGIHLSNGIGEHLQEVNDGVIRHEKFQFACLGCGGEFGPRVKAAAEKRNFSEIESPCRAVWNIADSMPGAKRKDVLAACEAAGIAFYTARTQYQLWRTVQKEMEQREAEQAKKS